MQLQQRDHLATVMQVAGDGTSASAPVSAPPRKRRKLESMVARMR